MRQVLQTDFWFWKQVAISYRKLTLSPAGNRTAAASVNMCIPKKNILYISKQLNWLNITHWRRQPLQRHHGRSFCHSFNSKKSNRLWYLMLSPTITKGINVWKHGNCYIGEKRSPVRGIEPRPRRWKRRILATRPHGMSQEVAYIHVIGTGPRGYGKRTASYMRCLSFKIGHYRIFCFLDGPEKLIDWWKEYLPCGESNPGRGGESAES